MAREQKLSLAAKRIRRKAHLRSEKSKSKNPNKYRVGDLVLVKALNISNTVAKIIAKFMSIYEGPYCIKKQIGPSTYLLTNIDDFSERGVFNSILFRPYFKNVQETKLGEIQKIPSKNGPIKRKRGRPKKIRR